MTERSLKNANAARQGAIELKETAQAELNDIVCPWHGGIVRVALRVARRIRGSWTREMNGSGSWRMTLSGVDRECYMGIEYVQNYQYQ